MPPDFIIWNDVRLVVIVDADAQTERARERENWKKRRRIVGWSPIVVKRDSLLLLLQIIEKQFLSDLFSISYPPSIWENNNAVPSAKFLLLCARSQPACLPDHFDVIRGKPLLGKS